MSWLESKGQVVTPSRAMRLALEEARLGWGFVSPNPLVGCAIVDKDHRLLGVGFHERVGADHAEISALKAVGDNSKINGAHIYVTLEPCAHQGRTGSCAQALAPLKPASVTYAVEDPNPLVAGKGAAVLLEAGVRCEHISQRADIPDRRELELLAEKLAEVFLHNHRTKEPFIGLKVATSTDGMMASSSGEPRWLTGAESRT
ncbi:MAG: bifunctional diaminohydroxyphosphoribosylaminopyrimidine deaminase/5-amino-6-(5-phosphoribosylamino)uracil reductase RibD, partial [Bdellovibrionota bacterium]